jgi:hypothetical protein
MRSIRCRSPRVTLVRCFSSAGLARRPGLRPTDGPVKTAPRQKGVAHAWSAVAAKPIRPPTFLAVRYVVFLLATLALLVVPSVASAAKGFIEQVASARWSTPFQCPDGSTATDGRLIVETDNFIEAGTPRGPNPPVRVGFVGQCPDGTFSWGFVRAAPTQFDADLKNVSVSGTFDNVRDNRGGLHTVSVDARWTGTGPIMTAVNGPGSKRKERSATATATIVLDGNTLVDGAATSRSRRRSSESISRSSSSSAWSSSG